MKKTKTICWESPNTAQAHHVERLVSLYRGCKRQQDNENANEAHKKRELQCHYDTDGCLVIHGRIPAAQGALIMKALERAMEHNDQPKPYNQKVPAGTSRRIACDCSLIKLTEDENGEPLSIGRKSRSIPPAIHRALRARDHGCRFPGCTNTQFIDGHHIRHWADGGETRLDNLVQLCRRHHRLVHEGGFGCERRSDGKLVFTDQRGNILAEYFDLPSIAQDENAIYRIQSQITHAEIDSVTCVPLTTAGESMDWNLAVGHLFALEKPPAVVH
ncbi:MAG: DUF222 domain-containing protein [Proteobacteria bacterium]|nr:DUF222 domain-containing protein [Pseudomonadota bacterium]